MSFSSSQHEVIAVASPAAPSTLEEKVKEILLTDPSAPYLPTVQKLVDILTQSVLEDPRVAVNETCHAEPLPAVSSSDCMAYPDVFTGELESAPLPKVVHAIQLGFDVDTLEIHLHEMHDVVDHFVLIESTRTNNKHIGKSLVWEQLKRTARFAPFSESGKVVHFTLDDAEFSHLLPDSGRSIWEVEGRQEQQRWIKLQQLNEHNKLLTDRDIIGFGDADEIASRWNVHLLKHCVQKQPNKSVDIGIWFPFGDLSKTFRTDWPVPGHPYTLGDPTFFKMGAIGDQTPNRRRGKSGDFLLGGVHLTEYPFGPQLLIKHLSCTECFKKGPKLLQDLRHALRSGQSLAEFFEKLFMDRTNGRARILPLEQARRSKLDDFDRIVHIPWFLKCNRQRFPRWLVARQTDPRAE